QAALRDVLSCGVGFHAIEAHGQHCAFVTAQIRRFGNVLAHAQVLAGLAHVTQRKELGATLQGSKPLRKLSGKIEHAGWPLSSVSGRSRQMVRRFREQARSHGMCGNELAREWNTRVWD